MTLLLLPGGPGRPATDFTLKVFLTVVETLSSFALAKSNISSLRPNEESLPSLDDGKWLSVKAAIKKAALRSVDIFILKWQSLSLDCLVLNSAGFEFTLGWLDIYTV